MTTEPRKLETITYSALATFRNCRKKYWWRYVRELVPVYRDAALRLGTLWHEITELFDQGANGDAVEAHLEKQLPARHADPEQRKFWHLLRAMYAAYVRKYAGDDVRVIATEKKFTAPIINPDTGHASRTFQMEGKVDAIIERNARRFVRERKSAACLDQAYLERLWVDFQSQLYAHYVEETDGVKIHGVEYDVAVKVQLKQAEGETEEAFQLRHAELCKKNKSGKSSAVRQMPESDEDFAKRLAEKYADGSLLHRETLLFSLSELNDMLAEVWELTQAILEARRRDAWYKNTSHCWVYGKPCPYWKLCRNPQGQDFLIETDYQHKPAHEELIEENDPLASAGGN